MFQLRVINQMEKKMCQYLDMMHNLVEISLAPFIPALLRVIPTKYTIITRLWIHAFHKLLEALRKLCTRWDPEQRKPKGGAEGCRAISQAIQGDPRGCCDRRIPVFGIQR